MKITKAMVIREAARQGITLDPCLLRDYPLGTQFWAIHHSEITETLQYPLVDRLWCILIDKPQRERQIRLDAIRPMSAKALAECDKAQAEYAKAQAEYAKAQAECDQARAKCDKARAECDKALAEYDKAQAACAKAQAACAKALITTWDRDQPFHPKWIIGQGLVFN